MKRSCHPFGMFNLLTCISSQSFGELNHRPLLVDLTVEEQTRLKVIYGSADGFHAVDLDSATVYDIYLPKHVSFSIFNSCFSSNDSFIRLKDQFLHTASSLCLIRMAWIFFCVTTTKAFMLTRWVACQRILCCNGVRCRRLLRTLALVRSWDGAIKRLRWVCNCFGLITGFEKAFLSSTDTFSRDGPFGRRFHAQESAAP